MRNFTIWHWRPRRRLRRRDCAATIVIAIVGINSTERLAHLLGLEFLPLLYWRSLWLIRHRRRWE
jgi:hypothetical protein